MKKLSYPFIYQSLCLLLSGAGVWAQQVPDPVNNTPSYPQPGNPMPVTYPGLQNLSGLSLFNYIKTQEPNAPMTTITSGGSNCRETRLYLDGLGRPLQSVKRKYHAEGYDVFQHHVYDNAGKEIYHYLPVAAPALLSNGKFKTNPLTLTHEFYNDNYFDDQPYSKTVFEAAISDRPVKKLGEGRSWVGSDRGKEIRYFTNSLTVYSSNGVTPHLYNVVNGFPRFTIGSNANDIPQYQGGYDANSLYLTELKDEDGKIIQEVRSKEGRLLMTRSVCRKLTGGGFSLYPATAPPEAFPEAFAYTVYVYDDLGRLRVTMSPEACKPTLANYQVVQGQPANTTYTYSWSVTSGQVAGLCYTYFYDAKGRLIEKKAPGKDVEYYVYDKRDRIAYFQDGKLRTDYKWGFTLFDVFDRPLCTGFYQNLSASQSSLQASLDNGMLYTPSDLVYYQKRYDLYHTYPSAALGGTTMLTYNYYDDYNYNELNSFSYDQSQFNGVPPQTGVDQPGAPYLAKGLLTGTKVRLLDAEYPTFEFWMTTANYYDKKGRIIQTKSENLKDGRDINSFVYYFQGGLWKNIISHENMYAQPVPGTTTPPLTNLAITRTFDRNFTSGGGNEMVKKVTQKIGNGINYNLANYNYDHMGRNVVKQFTAANVLQDYNIRGWISNINAVNTNNDPATSPYDPHIFWEQVFYDKGFGSKLYNGDIAGIKWKKSGNAAPIESYGYNYDWLNRLTHAEYRRFNDGSNLWEKTSHDYSMSNVTYDLNGNLKSMKNMVPLTGGGAQTGILDDLTYDYYPNSNQLRKVTDALGTSNPAGFPDFKDGTANVTNEYTYDENGGLVTDENKKITSITYNHFNKPEKITVDGKGEIAYVYNANGIKLQKRVKNTQTNAPADVYDYIGNLVYKNNTLQYIMNDEGRSRPIAVPQGNPVTGYETRFVYDYFIKDHVQNVRSTVTAEPMDGIYLARHEIASANTEQLIFDNIPGVREFKPGSTDPNDGMAALLNASDPKRRVGTAIMLQTMPGDRFNLSVDAFYEGEYTQSDETGTEDVVSSVMGALLGGNNYEGVPLSELPDNVRAVTNAFTNPELLGQLDNLINSNNNPDAPKAHLNYLFFNDKMELLPGNSGSIQVPSNPMGWITIDPSMVTGSTAVQSGQIATTEPGFLIVYIDNQSLGKDVWFDNLMVGHYHGVVSEEDHYYPFGLTVQTSQAMGAVDQPYKLTTKELESNFDIESYDFGARMQDMQLGRWWQFDPLADKYATMSPYVYCANNPAIFNDPDGREFRFPGDEAAQKAYAEMLHNATGNNYKIEGNVLSLVGEDKDFKGTKSETLIKTIQKGIDSKEVYTINLVGGSGDDKDVFIDSYDGKKIDMTDMKKLGDASAALQGAAIGHYLNEVQDGSGFKSAHPPSLKVEGTIYGELVGDKTITSRLDYSDAPKDGFQNVTFKYNDKHIFELQQGATSTSKQVSIDVGGTPFPSTEVTVTPTGELKSVKKK